MVTICSNTRSTSSCTFPPRHARYIHRPRPHSLPQPSPSPPPPSCHIFWDLDNLRPPSQSSLLSLAHLLITTVQTITTTNVLPITITLFANPTTVHALNLDPSSLSSSSSFSSPPHPHPTTATTTYTFITTTARPQSVDLAMRTCMLDYCSQQRQQEQQKGQHSILVCISDDSDFATPLRYISSRYRHMLTTVVVGMFQSNKRPGWAHPRKIESLALPCSAHIAIQLRLEQQESQQQGGGGGYTIGQVLMVHDMNDHKYTKL